MTGSPKITTWPYQQWKPVKRTSIHMVSSYGGASQSTLRWVKWFWRSTPLLLQCTFNSFFSLLLSFSKNGKQISGWGFDEHSHGFSQSSYSMRLGLGLPGPKFQETRNIFEQTSGQCSDWTWRWTVMHQDYLGLEPMVGEFEFTNSDNRTMTVAVRTFFSFFSSLLWIFA